MPISHVCQGCGEDLAALRPGPDPHYGLRVIVCPHCRLASVRTREPLLAGWRAARRFVSALALSLLHAAVLIPLAVTFGMLAGAEIGYLLAPGQRWLPTGRHLHMAWFLIGTAGAAGAWMGVTMPHRSPLQRAAAWLGLLAGPLALVAAIVLLSAPWRADRGEEALESPILYLGVLALVVASCPVVLATEPLARFGRFVLAALVSGVFRWRRNRARTLRSGH